MTLAHWLSSNWYGVRVWGWLANAAILSTVPAYGWWGLR